MSDCDHTYDEDGICSSCGECYTQEIERLRQQLAGWENMRESYYHLEKLLAERDKRIEGLKEQSSYWENVAFNLALGRKELRVVNRALNDAQTNNLKRIEELEANDLVESQLKEIQSLNERIEELEREHRWMAAKIGDKEYDAMREAMRELGGGCRWGRIGGE